MTIQEKLGSALRRLRNRQRLSQEAVALAAHIDRRYMSDVENGRRNVSLDILERLALFFHIPVSELMAEAERCSLPSSNEQLKSWLCDNGYDDAVVLEGDEFAAAVVGVSDDGRVVYDYDRMVNCLVDTQRMSADEAVEWLDYNTLRALAYMGTKAPIVVHNLKF